MLTRGQLNRLWIAIVVSLFASACSAGGATSASTPGASQVSPTAAMEATSTAEPDPLEGTWVTGPLARRDFVDAYVAAGGTEKEGEAFFAQLGTGATKTAIITIKLAGGSFTEFETGDDGLAVNGDDATYEPPSYGSVRLTAAEGSCVSRYAFHLHGDRLRFELQKPCAADRGTPYGTTLYTSFPFTRTA